MSSTTRRWSRRTFPPRTAVWLVPIVVFLSLSLPKLWQGSFSVDTGWYSAIALQAWRTAADGDRVSLIDLCGPSTADASIRYFNKPPLGFVLNGIWLWLLGPNIFAARLGSVIAGIGCIAATTLLSRACGGGRREALSAGLVLALTVEFTRHARAFSLDLWVACWCTLALALIVSSCRAINPVRANSRQHLGDANARTRRSWLLPCLLGALALTSALLTKPLVPFLTLAAAALWLLWQRRASELPRLALVLGASLLLPALWHLFMHARHGSVFIDQYLGREIIARAEGSLGGAADFNKGAAAPWYYLAQIVRSYWPWLPILLLAGAAVFSPRTDPRLRSTLRLVVCCTIVWIAALSLFADKRPRYLLPIYPIWSLAASFVLVRLAPVAVRHVWSAIVDWAAPVAAVVGMLLALLPVNIHRTEKPDDPWPKLIEFLRGHADEPWYAGGFIGHRSARVYLAMGRWAVPTSDMAGNSLASPPIGSLILYHRRDGFAPGVDERVVFSAGDLTVTRLQRGDWSPSPASDPGE